LPRLDVEYPRQYGRIDFNQCRQIWERDRLVEFVHRCVAQPEFYCRAYFRQVARIRCAASRRKIGLDSRYIAHSIGNKGAQSTWGREKCLAVGARRDGCANAHRTCDGSDALDQVGTIVSIVEPDAEPRDGLCRNDVGRWVVDINSRNLDVGGLEPVGSFVEDNLFDFGQNSNERPDRIVGQVRVGDVTLRSRNLDPNVHRSASSYLDRVAKTPRRSRFTNEAPLGHEPA